MTNGKGSKNDRTRALTGCEASPSEATIGSAGNGANPFDADLSGRRDVEDPPTGRDIDTDQIKKMAGMPDEDELEITAKQAEKQDVDLTELP